eukprot:3172079-Amphidinium_carterae.2
MARMLGWHQLFAKLLMSGGELAKGLQGAYTHIPGTGSTATRGMWNLFAHPGALVECTRSPRRTLNHATSCGGYVCDH